MNYCELPLSNNNMAEKKSIQKKKKSSFLSILNVQIGGVSDINIALSIKHLSLMLRSGLSLGDSLKVLGEQTSDLKLRRVYEEIYFDILNGMDLSSSMESHKSVFSDIIRSIIRAGEAGGTLEKNLVFLAEYLKRKHELNRKVKGALLYPMIVFALALLEMVGVIFLIIPQLEELFASFEDIPPLTQAIMQFATFLRGNAILVGIGLFIFFIAFRSFLRTKTGRGLKDRFFLRFPVISKLVKHNNLATFSRTLHILLESGIPLVRALEISSTSLSNTVYTKVLKEVHTSVKSGRNLADALGEHVKYFPSTYVKMIEVGETTGSLEENIFYLYEYHIEEVQDISSNLTTLLEPIMLIFIGGMIGFLALLIIGPIYQFTGSINA